MEKYFFLGENRRKTKIENFQLATLIYHKDDVIVTLTNVNYYVADDMGMHPLP